MLTKHFERRIRQRGIPMSAVTLVMHYGTKSGQKWELGLSEIKRLRLEKRAEIKALDYLEKKRGIVIVEDGEDAITTYIKGR